MANCGTVQLCFFFFNFLFGCIGIGLVGFVIWTLVTLPNASDIIAGTYVLTIVSFVLGVIIVTTGFIGFFAAACESFCLIKSYVGLMVAMLFIEVGLIIGIYTQQAEIPSLLTSSWDGLNTDTKNEIQSMLGCCSASNYTEQYGDDLASYPESCFRPYDVTNIIEKKQDNLYTTNCIDKLLEWLSSNLPIWVSVLIGLAIIQLLSGIFSCANLQMIQKSLKTDISPASPHGQRENDDVTATEQLPGEQVSDLVVTDLEMTENGSVKMIFSEDNVESPGEISENKESNMNEEHHQQADTGNMLLIGATANEIRSKSRSSSEDESCQLAIENGSQSPDNMEDSKQTEINSNETEDREENDKHLTSVVLLASSNDKTDSNSSPGSFDEGRGYSLSGTDEELEELRSLSTVEEQPEDDDYQENVVPPAFVCVSESRPGSTTTVETLKWKEDHYSEETTPQNPKMVEGKEDNHEDDDHESQKSLIPEDDNSHEENIIPPAFVYVSECGPGSTTDVETIKWKENHYSEETTSQDCTLLTKERGDKHADEHGINQKSLTPDEIQSKTENNEVAQKDPDNQNDENVDGSDVKERELICSDIVDNQEDKLAVNESNESSTEPETMKGTGEKTFILNKDPTDDIRVEGQGRETDNSGDLGDK